MNKDDAVDPADLDLVDPGEATDNEPADLSPLEQDALSRGWVPQEQWVEQGHSEDEWVDAKAFVARGKLMDVISKQSKKLKKAEKAIEDLKGLYQTVKEKTAAEVREALLAEKAVHLENGEYRKAVEVDEKLKEVTSEPTTKDKEQAANDFVEYFQDVWVDNNPWYNESKQMQVVADKIGAEYFKENPESSPEEVFKYVDKEIRKEFPSKFGRPRPTSGKVETSTRTGKSNTVAKSVRERVASLSEDERRTGKRFVEVGVFKSLDEYAANLVKNGL